MSLSDFFLCMLCYYLIASACEGRSILFFVLSSSPASVPCLRSPKANRAAYTTLISRKASIAARQQATQESASLRASYIDKKKIVYLFNSFYLINRHFYIYLLSFLIRPLNMLNYSLLC